MNKDVVFVNVDTQRDFMQQNQAYHGKLYIPEADFIQNDLAKLTEVAWRENIRTINTADWHTKDSEELSDKPDFAETFPEHCLENSVGASYIAATQTQHDAYKVDWRDESFDKEKLLNSREVVIRKDKFDVFSGNPHTEEIMNAINPKVAVVYGVAADVCVNYAVQGLAKRGVDVYVPLDGVKELNTENFSKLKDEWKSLGVNFTSVDDIVNTYRK